MKLTKAKYNWLVAQYNYRKNKEQLIEISDEEYQRLTNNSGIIDDEIIDESIYFEKIICIDCGSGEDVDIQDLPDLNEINNNAYTVCGNELLDIDKLHDVYVKYSNDTYKEITHQIKYHLDKNIGILKSTGVNILTYYPPESIDEDTIDLQIIGEYNGYVFNWKKIKLYSNYYYCNFMFDTSLHPLPCLLTNILDNPGHFCKIKIQIRNGIKHLHITSNYDCAFEDISLTTSIENERNYTLGINNCIIVGKSSYDNILVAYDGCCPNCNDKELQWANNSNQLYCDDCKLSYDVNNGVIINGNGKQLLKYLCDYNGTILRVRN